MSNYTKTQPICPCASGDVNYATEGDAYCPWCWHNYGPWARFETHFAKCVTPIDYEDTSLSSYEDATSEDALMEFYLVGDC